jgi:hypothetical protein
VNSSREKVNWPDKEIGWHNDTKSPKNKTSESKNCVLIMSRSPSIFQSISLSFPLRCGKSAEGE